MKLQFSKEGGFSLIEIMISVGVMSILVLAGLSMSSYFAQLRTTQKQMVDQIELQRALESVLTTNCGCNFAKPTSPLGYAGTGDLTFSTNGLAFYTDNTCATKESDVVMTDGSLSWSTAGLKINVMKITGIVAKSATDFQGNLRIEFDNTKGPVAPYKTISKPFSFTIDGANKITACSYGSSGGGSGSAGLNDQMKMQIFSMMHFDPSGINMGTPCPLEGYGHWPPSLVDSSGRPWVVYLSDSQVNANATMPSCPVGYSRYDSCSRSDFRASCEGCATGVGYETKAVLCWLD